MRHSTYRIAGHGPLRPPAPATPLLSFPRACAPFLRLFFLFALISFLSHRTRLEARKKIAKTTRRVNEVYCTGAL